MSRLIDRLAELARIGADEAGGVTRLAFSPEEAAARELVAGWMREAGLVVEVDAATNLIGRRPGAGPAIVTGSHLDSVRLGGALDGAYGVVAAVEAAAMLADTELTHPLTVVAFANEEGSVAPPFTGSRTIAGLPVDVTDSIDGDRTLGEAIAAAGGRPGELAAAAWPAGSVTAFLELHIEQGPVLEQAGEQIGIVEAITGRAVLDITVTGAANHAGTTPMPLRRDALVPAAQLILDVQRLALDGLVRVATVGQIGALPGAQNVIPGQVRLGVDIRDTSDGRVRDAAARITDRCAELAKATHTEITVAESAFVPAVATDPTVVAALDAVVARGGLKSRRLPSGAGHDAQVMANLAPVAMIFVPSRGGISHSAQEYSDPEALDVGLTVLRDTIFEIDRRLP
jgi:hydantoinase/carbamoylase family amidase